MKEEKKKLKSIWENSKPLYIEGCFLPNNTLNGNIYKKLHRNEVFYQNVNWSLERMSLPLDLIMNLYCICIEWLYTHIKWPHTHMKSYKERLYNDVIYSHV